MSRFCDCLTDGYCQRYGRDMVGRFRQICAGADVDMGTAAAFRAQWAADAPARPPNPRGPLPLLLRTDQAPGDAVAMTAAVYSLHRAHPEQYQTAVVSPWSEVFAHNPDVVSAGLLPQGGRGAAELRMHYPAIRDSNRRGIHFMQGWCEHLGAALGMPVPLLTNRPHLYFADPAPPVEDFWIVCSGGKRDFTNKLWGHERYQEVIGRLSGKVKFVQVGSAVDDHPLLYMREGRNLVGKTTLRGLFDLVRRARGVLCGVSLLMHVAAALEKPAIVVAGGREPVPWNVYPRQQYLHTVGALPCSDLLGEVGGGCWRSRVVPLGDDSVLDRDPCLFPRGEGRAARPACMGLISTARVAEAVLLYDRQYEQTRPQKAGK